MAKSPHSFDGKPIRDAEVPTHLPIIQIDAEKAEPIKGKTANAQERFRQCVVAQSCSRVFGEETKVRIMRAHAYLSLPGDKFARRYVLGKDARAVVESFDRNEPIETGRMITFNPPGRGQKLAEMRKYARAYAKRRAERAKAGEQIKRRPRKTTPIDGLLRDGNYVKLA